VNAFITVDNRHFDATELLTLLTQCQMLPQFLKELLIVQATQDITLTLEEEALAVEQFKVHQHIKDESQCQAWLRYHRMTADQLFLQAVRRRKLEKFKQMTWASCVETDFLKYKAQLDQFTCSILRTKDGELAQELYFRLKEGEQTFADLAPQYSQGTEAQSSGLIGPVTASSMHPKLLQILSSSKPGQLWPPQRLEEWFVIVRLEQYLPAQLDDAIRQQILERRFQEWLEQQLQTVQLSIPTGIPS
jgi:parvulin-like peptidyl-prolyl isomerase